MPKQIKSEQIKPQQRSGLFATRRSLAPGALALALALAGCADTGGIEPAARPVTNAATGFSAEAMPEIAARWWEAFRDPALSALIDHALAGSPTLGLAQARIERARAAQAGAESADGLQLTGDASVTRQHFSGTSIYPPPLGDSTRTMANAQLGAAWELDLFGRNRAAIAAALGTTRAAEAEAGAAKVALATTIARNYVQLGRLLAEREVAVRSLRQREQTLSLIRQRVSSGIDTNVELRQGEGALPEARQQIEQIDEQVALTRNALAELSAQPASALQSLKPTLDAARLVAPPAAVPADLLARRADVAAARWKIEAATRDTDAARAQFYPNVNLTAFAGLASIGLSQLLKPASEQFGVGPAIHLPIFDAGRLRANLRGRTADLDAAVETYNGAVLGAVREVADQLASLRAIDRQRNEQAQALEAAEAAYDLSRQRFEAGLGTYLTVLSTEATVLAQRRQSADLAARALEAQVALVRALGGGYVPQAAARPA